MNVICCLNIIIIIKTIKLSRFEIRRDMIYFSAESGERRRRTDLLRVCRAGMIFFSFSNTRTTTFYTLHTTLSYFLTHCTHSFRSSYARDGRYGAMVESSRRRRLLRGGTVLSIGGVINGWPASTPPALVDNNRGGKKNDFFTLLKHGGGGCPLFYC